MKKYFVNINDSDKADTVEISESTATVNNRSFEYDHKFISGNVLVLRINNENFFIDITENSDDESIDLRINDLLFKASCRSDLDLLLQSLANGNAGKSMKKMIHSPMPGIIKKLNVAEGQDVKKGDVLLVLEAMKMENEIKATGSCVIKKVNVSEMSTVEKNELLLEIE